jgi:tRNA nucleotidyltransferase (CCA-adding enzyme)
MPVQFILNTLSNRGYEAYVVGGCVRDSIMGLSPNDWDICTSALPEQVREIFIDYKVIPTGLKHGTVTLILDEGFKQSFEITTYRTEGKYTDNRHPDEIKFVSDLKLDLSRRDFTINAMAYNETDGLIDLFGGLTDIKNKVIRCVGDGEIRFQEDALRIIRAIRFALRFNYEIDNDTVTAMNNHKELLKNISIERISDELSKILNASIETEYYDKRIMEQEYNTKLNLFGYLFDYLKIIVTPEMNLNAKHIFKRLWGTIDNLELRLAIIFDNESIEEILRYLRFPKEIIVKATTIRHYGYKIISQKNKWIDFREQPVLLRYYARKLLCNITVCPAEFSIDYAKTLVPKDSLFRIDLSLLRIELHKCFMNKDIYSISYLAINGNDILALGYEGKQIGNILKQLLDLVMKEQLENNKQQLFSAIPNLQIDENNCNEL